MITLTKAFNTTSATVIANQAVCFDPVELENSTVLKILNDNDFTITMSALKNGLVYYIVERTVKIALKTTYITAKTLENVCELFGIEDLAVRVHNSKKFQGDSWNFAGFTGTPKQVIKHLGDQLHIKIEMVKAF